MAVMEGVNKVLGGDVGAQALHLDFDMDEVICWKHLCSCQAAKNRTCRFNLSNCCATTENKYGALKII